MSRLRAMAAISALLMPCASGSPRAEPSFVTPALLLTYPAKPRFKDYRPAINADGTRIVFERQFRVPGEQVFSATVNLFIADLKDPAPVRLVEGFVGSARADWCWRADQPSVDGPIAFSVPDRGVFTIPPPAGDPRNRPTHVPGSTNWIYPTWLPGCAALAVDATDAIAYGPKPHDTKTSTNPGPATRQVDIATGAIEKNLSGGKLWAGYPSIDPVSPQLVAFAGQQFLPTGYDQDKNYIYTADSASSPPRVKPLDWKAPVNTFDPQYQGRAPNWSPDGQWIAFESNRACADKTQYAIFLEDGQGRNPARQVTACGYNAQHAKWYRLPVAGRTLLITCVRLYPNYIGQDALMFNATGIASLDVTNFVKP